jgi:hypothetical protein
MLPERASGGDAIERVEPEIRVHKIIALLIRTAGILVGAAAALL